MNNIFKQLISKFMQTMLVSFIGMLIGYFLLPPSIAAISGLLAIVILIVMFILKKSNITMTTVHILTFLLGISISTAIKDYVSTIGVGLVLGGFGITALIFVGLSIYAYKSKKDFSFLGGFLFAALFALIVISIVGTFIHSSILSLALAWVGVLIFSGYVLYDISEIKRISEDEIPLAVLNLYLDFVNLFLNILRIVAEFASNNK